jgi:hypothetical protein
LRRITPKRGFSVAMATENSIHGAKVLLDIVKSIT